MEIIITNWNESEFSFAFSMTCGKKSALVMPYKTGKVLSGIQVISLNAMHRVYRGPGRNFDNVDEALKAYRSPEMKAMISHAAQMAREAEERRAA